MKTTFYILLFLFTSLFLSAQNPVVPHWPVDGESAFAPGANDGRTTENVIPAPPPTQVRTMAEWEEVQALVITWTGFPEILTEIVRNAVGECKVFIVTTSVTQTSNYLTNAGVALDNVEFLPAPFNSIWIRDYGPWTVYQNDVDSLSIVDWIYNRPRPDDDAIPAVVAEKLDLVNYGAIATPYDWIHTGGNHLRDGLGTAFSSDLVLDENPGKSLAEINEIARLYLGVDNYVLFPKLPYDEIHHLDMHMRLIDEETIIFGEYPEGRADGPQIEANIRYLQTQQMTPFGNPYRIIRIPMPPDQYGKYPDELSFAPCNNSFRDNGCYRTYTNALFINKTIIVPVYEEQYDTAALRIYRESLPGYNVVGIDCNDIISLDGALHCITKLVGTNDPLWIAHPRLRDTYDTANDYQTDAIIKHRSGIAGATLYYRVEPNTAYQNIAMTRSDPEEDHWTAAIPNQSAGTRVEYYISATANSGKTQVRPLVAPEGYYDFRVKGTESPTADFNYDIATTCVEQPIRFFDQSTGPITTWAWSFPGATPANSTLPDPVVAYAEPGVYNVRLTVTNALGMNTLQREELITVEAAAEPFFEDFSGTLNQAWTIDDYNRDGNTWEVIGNGNCRGAAFRMDNYSQNTRDQNDFLRARVDLRELSAATLQFDVAYATSGSNADALRVNVYDCDGMRNQVFLKHGTALATHPTVNGVFFPDECADWRQENVDLSAFAGSIVTIEFENIGDFGNMLYLDNIDIAGPESPNLAPVVTLTSPIDGTIYTEPDLPQVVLTAAAGDTDGYVAEVAFFVNGDSVGRATSAPFLLDFTLLDFGSSNIQARATDNDGAVSWSPVIMVAVSPVGTKDDLRHIAGLLLGLQPNPARNAAELIIDAPRQMELQVALFDVLGRQYGKSMAHIVPGKNRVPLAIADLPAGTYTVRVAKDGAVSTLRLVVLY